VDFSRINVSKELPKLDFLREILKDYTLYLCRGSICIYGHNSFGYSNKSNYVPVGTINSEYLELVRDTKFMEMMFELKCKEYYATAPEDGINPLLPIKATADRLLIKKPRSDLKDCTLVLTSLGGVYTFRDINW
jgi:hypothetical protein